ncbi:hypothetical protein [Nocardioides sp.]|uniref:hypothetical protein n=1 Tax=Nocardioides sp. TaxID=35761 RepID=UPI00261F9EE4|nr:hypothetical protein [Nocardioides sp.]MDI6908404.1 hypothetical protein [Nocardioides sp.]
MPFDPVQDVFPWRSVPVLKFNMSDQGVRETVGVVVGKGLLAPRATQGEIRHR